MTKIVFNFEGVEGTKLKRALEAHALEQGQTVEECMLPILRGIAQQIGLDASDTDEDQEASLAKAERKAARAKQARDDRDAESARLVAKSETRRKDAEAKAIAAANAKTTEKEK